MFLRARQHARRSGDRDRWEAVGLVVSKRAAVYVEYILNDLGRGRRSGLVAYHN